MAPGLHQERTPAGPLPIRLTSLLSPDGQARLRTCGSLRVLPLARGQLQYPDPPRPFVGIASSVMTLNASEASKPLSVPSGPYRYFTECNIFNETARARLDLDQNGGRGADVLAQVQWLLNAQDGVRASCFHAGVPEPGVASEAVPPCAAVEERRAVPRGREGSATARAIASC